MKTVTFKIRIKNIPLSKKWVIYSTFPAFLKLMNRFSRERLRRKAEHHNLPIGKDKVDTIRSIWKSDIKLTVKVGI